MAEKQTCIGDCKYHLLIEGSSIFLPYKNFVGQAYFTVCNEQTHCIVQKVSVCLSSHNFYFGGGVVSVTS